MGSGSIPTARIILSDLDWPIINCKGEASQSNTSALPTQVIEDASPLRPDATETDIKYGKFTATDSTPDKNDSYMIFSGSHEATQP
jgi:hypothetical protein